MKLITLFIILLLHPCTAQPQRPEDNIEASQHQDHPGVFQDHEALSGQFQIPEDHIDEEYLARVQGQATKQEINNELHPWVDQQLKAQKPINDFQKLQSFISHLQPEEYFEFKWNLAIPDSQKKQYHLSMSVFTYENGDDIELIINPQEQQYVEIDTKENIKDSYTSFGKVYVEKAFTVTFQKQSKFVRLFNKNDRDILVQIDMEMQRQDASLAAVQALKNEHFALPAQKIATIFEQFKENDKSRSKMSKWQWGFLQRQERYDNQMLKLTGVELLVIFVTTFVQMYCIKSALDKKQII